MQLSRADLADFAYFLAIAEHGSFRRAATSMGVTTFAISHAITALEGRRGVRLMNRTTRTDGLASEMWLDACTVVGSPQFPTEAYPGSTLHHANLAFVPVAGVGGAVAAY